MTKKQRQTLKTVTDRFRRDRRILGLSLLTSTIIIVFGYILGNTAYSLPGDNAALMDIMNYKRFFGQQIGNSPDSLLLINVCYDKQLVEYQENDIPVGNNVITDREKLLQLLTIAKEADNYRYIFLDVLFNEGLDSDVDSALFQTIISMDRIVIPEHRDERLKDPRLYEKAANADYSTTWKVLTFSRYQFLRYDSVQTVPLKMYADKKGDKGYGIVPHWGGLWYTDDGRLCQNGVTLQLRIIINDRLLDQEGQARECNYSYLGADILDMDPVFPVKEQLKDKIVVIGDFKNDYHTTYMRAQPGSTIVMNAYLALTEGDHLFNWTFAAVMFLIYTIVGTFYLRGNSFSSLFKNPWLSVLMSFLSTATLFFVISLIANMFEVVLNIWVPTTVYSLIDTYVQKRNLYKARKELK